MKETKFRNTEIGMIPEEWKMYSIGKDCSVKARIGWQGLTTSEYLQTGDYGLITSTDLIEGKVNWNTCVFVSEERYKQDTNIIVKNGDVLVSKDGTIGKVAVVSNLQYPTTLNSGVFVIRTKMKNHTRRIGVSIRISLLQRFYQATYSRLYNCASLSKRYCKLYFSDSNSPRTTSHSLCPHRYRQFDFFSR